MASHAKEHRKDTYELLSYNAQLNYNYKSAYTYALLFKQLSDSLLNDKARKTYLNLKQNINRLKKKKKLRFKL